jgi:hypothetical protein
VSLRRLIICLCCLGCGAGDAVIVRPDAGFAIESCQGGGSFALDGVFGVLANLNVHINAMGLVDTDAAAEILLLLDISQEGTGIEVASAAPCALKVPEVPVAGQDKPVIFEVSQRLIDSVRPVTEKKAKLGSLATCATFESDPITLLIGTRLSPPTAGILPEADSTGAFPICQPSQADCYDAITNMCACDQEQDGKPGATFKAANVPGIALDEVHVDLRATFALRGEVWSSDRVQGEVDIAMQLGILGCSKAGGVGCSTGEVNLVKNLNPKITESMQDPSIFRAVRVASTTTCAELIDRRDMLFPR